MILTPKGQVSTNKIALLELGTDFSKKLLKYRELKKLTSTYTEPILANLDKNNRLHSMFNQARTVTGRLSSSNPINLQNIPSRTQLGKKVREVFIVDKGLKLLVLDFNQIELRLIAHFSQDTNMLKAYKEGVDIHEQTAKGIFNTQSPTKEQRFIGKTCNFSISYGAGSKKLAQTINQGELGVKVTEDETKGILERFNALYSGISTWKRGVWYATRHAGYIKTLLGRVIPIQGFKGSWKEVSQAERDSVSYLVQGSAADIMKKSIIELISLYPNLQMVSTVHDELLIELDEEEASDPTYCLMNIDNVLSHVVKLSIPLKVDLKVVNNWGEK